MYCHPDVYDGVPDRLFRNRCDGTFEDVSASSGIAVDEPTQSKGLGLAWADFNDDDLPDLFVANDSTRNFLFLNRGQGRFDEVGVPSGLAFNEMGKTEAGMGAAVGDLDGDGQLDLFVTNLDLESNTYYRNLGELGELVTFEDATAQGGLLAPSLPWVGFGTNLLDIDLDGDLDVFVANGHILDNVERLYPDRMHAQADQLYLHHGGRFRVAPEAMPRLDPLVSRGSAAADLDNDGDLDLIVTANGGPVRLLRNDLEAAARHWIGFRTRSHHGGRAAIGARLVVHAAERRWIREVSGAGSYLSHSDLRVHVGLGDIAVIDRVEVRWPEGDRQTFDGSELAVDRYHDLEQPATRRSESPP